MAIFDSNYQVQQQSLAGLLGGTMQSPLGALFGGAMVAQQQQSPMQWKRYAPLTEGVIPFKYGLHGEKLPLTFIDKLREEIDNWLHS